jgi:hypothetical protein
MTYFKAFLALVVSAAAALVTALGTGNGGTLSSIDTTHWLIAIATVLGSGGIVALVANIQGVAGGIAKAIVAFLSGGVGSLVIATNDGHISQAELLTAFIAAVVATGFVYQGTNSPRSTA